MLSSGKAGGDAVFPSCVYSGTVRAVLTELRLPHEVHYSALMPASRKAKWFVKQCEGRFGAADCASGHCVASVCSACPAGGCADGRACASHGECASLHCHESDAVCAPFADLTATQVTTAIAFDSSLTLGNVASAEAVSDADRESLKAGIASAIPGAAAGDVEITCVGTRAQCAAASTLRL